MKESRIESRITGSDFSTLLDPDIVGGFECLFTFIGSAT